MSPRKNLPRKKITAARRKELQQQALENTHARAKKIIALKQQQALDYDNAIPAPPAKFDSLVPDAQAAEEVGRSLMFFWRCDHEPTPDPAWPLKIVIRNRNFRSRRDLENYKAILHQRAVAEREKLLHEMSMA